MAIVPDLPKAQKRMTRGCGEGGRVYSGKVASKRTECVSHVLSDKTISKRTECVSHVSSNKAASKTTECSVASSPTRLPPRRQSASQAWDVIGQTYRQEVFSVDPDGLASRGTEPLSPHAVHMVARVVSVVRTPLTAVSRIRQHHWRVSLVSESIATPSECSRGRLVRSVCTWCGWVEVQMQMRASVHNNMISSLV
jgi:hypothetical protein